MPRQTRKKPKPKCLYFWSNFGWVWAEGWRQVLITVGDAIHAILWRLSSNAISWVPNAIHHLDGTCTLDLCSADVSSVSHAMQSWHVFSSLGKLSHRTLLGPVCCPCSTVRWTQFLINGWKLFNKTNPTIRIQNSSIRLEVSCSDCNAKMRQSNSSNYFSSLLRSLDLLWAASGQDVCAILS